MKKVFVAGDEPVEVRRKKMIARLKRRALADGKHAQESDDGFLYIDQLLIYSVKDNKVTSVLFGNSA